MGSLEIPTKPPLRTVSILQGCKVEPRSRPKVCFSPAPASAAHANRVLTHVAQRLIQRSVAAPGHFLDFQLALKTAVGFPDKAIELERRQAFVNEGRRQLCEPRDVVC